MSIIEHWTGRTPAFISRALDRLAEVGLRADWSGRTTDLGRAVSGRLTVYDGDGPHEFSAVAVASANATDAALLPHDEQTVLIAEHVSEVLAGHLRDRGWGGFVDAAGNASLRGNGLFVEIRGRRAARPMPAPSATAPFTRAGLPVTFALLATREHFGITATQRAVSESSGVSLGTVNRVFRALRERTPPMMEGRQNDLTRPEILEREWISAYSTQQTTAWPEERFTSDVWTTPDDLLDVALPEGAFFGSEVAAARLGASIRPASALLHVDGGNRTRKDLIRQGRLRRDENGMIRLRPAVWRIPPVPTENQTVPRLLLLADLLLEDDPRTDEISAEFHGNDR